MNWPSRIVYVRHAESVGNADADRTGTRDTMLREATYPNPLYPLSERGKRQAQITGAYLRRTFGTFDAIYTSTYLRTQETLLHLGIGEATFDDGRLDEVQFGIHHFHPSEELQKLYPGELARLQHYGNYHYRAPGGENGADVEMRVRDFSRSLQEEHEGQTVCIVGHGNLFKFWRRVHERLPLSITLSKRGHEALANCGVATYHATLGTKQRAARLTLESIVVPWQGDPELDPPQP